MNIQKLLIMFLALIIIGTASVSAVNLRITSLDVNSHSILSTSDSNGTMDYKRGQALDLYICVDALTDVYDAQIYADITGYDYAKENPGKVSDMTDTFELKAGHNDCFDLSLEVPTNIDKDYFKLRIRADDRNGTSVDKTYQLYLKGIDRKSAVEITDFTIEPQEVIAGRAFTAQVKVKNLGDITMNDLKITMSVPELNIQASQYMDDIEPDKSKTFEELLLRVPECTKAGTYDVQFTVEFDQYHSTESAGTITVITSDACGATNPGEDKSTISVPNMQDVAQGTSVVYPIVIANNGNSAKTYSLSVTGASTWSTTRIDPSAVIVVPAGQSKTAYLYVSANANAELGDKIFTLNIDDGAETKNVPLIAKITKGSNTSDLSGFKQALEIGLVVLVIILIIVGLIVGFSKMKENRKDTEPYY